MEREREEIGIALADDCPHLWYGCDLDTRTPLPGTADNLVLIQHLPILIGHIVCESAS